MSMPHENLTLKEASELVKYWANNHHYYYVYILSDEQGNLFYIGKGRGDRFRQHQQRWGTYWVYFSGFFFFEREAQRLERETIALGRREGWPLKNISPGGDGANEKTRQTLLRKHQNGELPVTDKQREAIRQNFLALQMETNNDNDNAQANWRAD